MTTPLVDLNIDLNSLFQLNLNYNFDVLKMTIDGLIKNQRSMYKEIEELKGGKRFKRKRTLNDQEPNEEEGDDEDMNNRQDSSASKELLKDINAKLEELNGRTGNNEKEIVEMGYKFKDFDILGMFKGSGGGEGDSDSNAMAIALIRNLEEKVMQRLKQNEERTTKNENDIFKAKNDLRDVKNSSDGFNRSIKKNKEQIEELTGDIDDLKESLKDLKKQMETDIQEQIDKLNEIMKEKFKEYDEKLEDKFTSMISTNNNQDKDESSKQIEKNDANISSSALDDIHKQIKDLRKHIAEAEKNINKIPSTLNIDGIWKEIKAMKEEINQKCPLTKHIELASLVDELMKKMAVIQDQLSQHLEDTAGHEDVLLFRKKIESLTSQMFQLQNNSNNNDDKHQANSNQIIPAIDETKYLEIETFKGFKATLNEQLSYLSDKINENRRLIDEIFHLLKQKATHKELKDLEVAMMGKLEELKLACTRKFADKMKMDNNMKYIELQIKDIHEINIKKSSDKGESWLLAKKPLGGHLCASCETYIGDLRETNQYMPWNKYPMRDNCDRVYRVGAGVSKMFQSVCNDPMMDRREPYATSNDFYTAAVFKKEKEQAKEGEKERSKEKEKDKEKDINGVKREASLPKLKRKANASSPSIFENEAQEEYNQSQDDEENQNNPKMIYKKPKKMNES